MLELVRPHVMGAQAFQQPDQGTQMLGRAVCPIMEYLQAPGHQAAVAATRLDKDGESERERKRKREREERERERERAREVKEE